MSGATSPATFAKPADAIQFQFGNTYYGQAVFEKTDKAMVVPCDIGWSDVGAYDALWSDAPKGLDGNALQGVALAPGGVRNLVITDGPLVVVSGVDDLAVIVDGGVVLVAPRASAEAVRAAVEAVKEAGREDVL